MTRASIIGSAAIGVAKPAVAAPLLLILSLAVCTAGIGELPLDGHEVFVVQTAQEMHDRGDWTVPYFDGAPRLTKPPLAYWLTGFAAWLSGDLAQIQPWHGRVPSVLGAVGVVLLTYALGANLYERSVGFLAALIAVSTLGVATYSHDARPDMLYAFWCTTVLVTLCRAWLAPDGGIAQRCWAVGAWLAAGLATLTKGPQLPAMLLFAFALFLASERVGWGRALRTLRPIAGLPLAVAICASWWWLLAYRLGEGGLAGTQLGGTLLVPAWSRVLNPYYLYEPLRLLLPWAILIPLALRFVWRTAKRDPNARLCALLWIVPALLLSLGPQRRWLYMLPALAPACLLLAAGALSLSSKAGGDERARAARWLVALHWLSIIGAFTWLWTRSGVDEHLRGSLLFVSPAIGVGLAWWWFRARRSPQPSDQSLDLIIVAGVFALMWIAAISSPSSWSRDRFERWQIATLARRELTDATALAIWRVDPKVFRYYAGAPLERLSGPEAIEPMLERTGIRELLLILRSSDLARLPSHLDTQILAKFIRGEDAFSLVRLSRGVRRKNEAVDPEG